VARHKRQYRAKRLHVQACKHCGKEFETTSYAKVYCSKECRDEFNKWITKEWQEAHLETHIAQKQAYRQKISTRLKIAERWKQDNGETRVQSLEEGTYKAPWSVEDDLYLYENWNNYTKKELATILKRTIGGVNSRYHKLVGKYKR
jgi:hypothetical protein